MIKKYSKYLLAIVLFSMLFSCGDDPIELKERMIEYMKNHPTPNDNNGDDNPDDNPSDPENPDPNTPKEEFKTQYFNFDIWKKVSGKDYSVPLNNKTENSSKSYWVSASNFGYAYFGAPDKNYPATELKNGKKGSGVQLVTKEKIGNLVAGSIYSGHIYTKYFAVKKNPTRFGQNWKGNEPVKIKFYYQYKSGIGKKFGNIKQDFGAIRAVLYEVTEDEKFYLDKYTLNKHKFIVMKAFEKLENTSKWTSKIAEFKVINNERYSSLDFKNKKYRLAIVFSSSSRGSEDTGIVGSTLKIDEVTLYSKKD